MSEYNRHKWAMEWMHGGGRDPNGRSLDDEIRIGKEDWLESQRVAEQPIEPAPWDKPETPWWEKPKEPYPWEAKEGGPAQLVQPGPGRQGYGGAKQGGDATALSFYEKDVAEFGEEALNEAAQLLEEKNYSELGGKKYFSTKDKIRYELKTYGSVLKESESRKRAAKVEAKRKAKIKINLIEATQEGFFSPEEFIDKNNITLKQLEREAKQLQRNIYIKRGILTGTKSASTLEWLTSNDFKLDNTLKKLSQSELIVFKRDRIGDILYDAFGREFEKGSTTKLNPTRDVEKYNVIKKNLHEFEELKRAIAAKYPSIKFQWDHPLSKQTIKALMTGTAEDLSRVNVLDAELNNNFKKALSEKYLKSLTAKDGKVDLEAKRAVEKIAKDLKLNIGNISDDVKRFERGVVSLEKLNIRDEIIKSLKNQKDLSTNFKSYLKNNPELFKIAGFKDTSKLGTKLTQVTDIQIQGVKKIIEKSDKNVVKMLTAAGFDVEDCAMNKKCISKVINNDLYLAKKTGRAAKFSKFGRLARGVGWLVGWADIPIELALALPHLLAGNVQDAKAATTAGWFGYGGKKLEQIDPEKNPEAYKYFKHLQDIKTWMEAYNQQQEAESNWTKLGKPWIDRYTEHGDKSGYTDKIIDSYEEALAIQEEIGENYQGYKTEEGEEDWNAQRIAKEKAKDFLRETIEEEWKEGMPIRREPFSDEPYHWAPFKEDKITSLEQQVAQKGESFYGGFMRPGVKAAAERLGAEDLYDDWSDAFYGRDVRDAYSDLPLDWASQLAALEKKEVMRDPQYKYAYRPKWEERKWYEYADGGIASLLKK
jgi:hypothetical protein